jgi:hypothetical protein
LTISAGAAAAAVGCLLCKGGQIIKHCSLATSQARCNALHAKTMCTQATTIIIIMLPVKP